MRWLVVILGCLVGPVHGYAHPFHTTRAEIAHKLQDKVLQVSLHIKFDDLKAATRKTEQSGRDYVLGRFVVLRNDSPLKAKWLGQERSKTGVWFYWSYQGVTSLNELNLKVTLLGETEPNALHTVRIIPSGAAPYVVGLSAKRTFSSLKRP